MRSAVAFWMRVYLEVTTSSGLLHDSVNLGVVYETIQLRNKPGTRARQREVNARRKHWKGVLNTLAKGVAPRNERERALVRVFAAELGREPTKRDFAKSARQIRFQLGQRDKFRKALIRAGAYEDEMRAIFREANLPEDLTVLPYVESSFNVRAYSKYGAAGMWQFMRGTGRRYMTVNYTVDERLDPMEATEAAARLLRDNYRSLKSWPLAITAYNHGAAGMRRAKKKLGTDRMDVIIKKYKSRSFGFASRNFYAQFLAARRVARNYEAFFGPLERNVPEALDVIEMPFYTSLADLRDHLGVSEQTVKHYNPALRPPVFKGSKRIPKGYRLRLPAGTAVPSQSEWLAQIPKSRQFARQHKSNLYKVRRGDTLSRIAKRNGTSIRKLVALNNLPSKHRIYPGQVLQLPGGSAPKQKPAKKKFEIVRSAQAAPKPNPKRRADPPPPKLEAAATPPAVARKPEVTRETPVAEAATTETLKPLSEEATVVAAADKKRNIKPGLVPPAADTESRFRRVEKSRILVDADETLGHYAEWLEIPTQKLRSLNHLSPRRSLRLGQKLKLDFSKVTPEEFKQRRMEYHKAIEEDFFGTFRITGTVEHKLVKGESLWVLSHKTYSTPGWLIQRYNPAIDLTRLTPGTKLQIPLVERNS